MSASDLKPYELMQKVVDFLERESAIVLAGARVHSTVFVTAKLSEIFVLFR